MKTSRPLKNSLIPGADSSMIFQHFIFPENNSE